MPELNYVLYDTAEFGVSADAEHVLFQVAQGADSTHNEKFTNSRGSGVLPNQESFLLKGLRVFADYDVPEADVKKIWRDSYIEIRVADRTLFKAPLTLVASHNSFGGVVNQANAADGAIVGIHGKGFMFDIPIKIDGGKAFKVNIYQGTALASANSSIKVCLIGNLNMP